MIEDATKVIKEVMSDMKDAIPKPIYLIITILGIACVLLAWVFKQVLDSYESLEQSIAVPSIWILLTCILTDIIGIIILLIVFVLIPYRKKKKTVTAVEKEVDNSKTEQPDGIEVKGKITAYIVKQNDPERDKKFIAINQGVKKSYSVLGAALSSLAEQEAMLEQMAKDKVKIRLCTMNPDIAVDDICRQEIKNETCFLIDALKKQYTQDDNIQISVQTLLDDAQKGNNSIQNSHLLNLMHVLIDSEHIKSYYSTASNFKEKISMAKKALNAISTKIKLEHGEEAIVIADADSFIPISMTIADEKESEGRMIVEFHLPFTVYKVLFELEKEGNEELFSVFLKFYELVWKRARGQKNEKALSH